MSVFPGEIYGLDRALDGSRLVGRSKKPTHFKLHVATGLVADLECGIGNVALIIEQKAHHSVMYAVFSSFLERKRDSRPAVAIVRSFVPDPAGPQYQIPPFVPRVDRPLNQRHKKLPILYQFDIESR